MPWKPHLGSLKREDPGWSILMWRRAWC